MSSSASNTAIQPHSSGNHHPPHSKEKGKNVSHLLHLVTETCSHHRQWHLSISTIITNTGNEKFKDIPKKCREDMISIQQILHKMEQEVIFQKEMVYPMCLLYKSFMEENPFCPFSLFALMTSNSTQQQQQRHQQRQKQKRIDSSTNDLLVVGSCKEKIILDKIFLLIRLLAERNSIFDLKLGNEVSSTIYQLVLNVAGGSGTSNDNVMFEDAFIRDIVDLGLELVRMERRICTEEGNTSSIDNDSLKIHVFQESSIYCKNKRKQKRNKNNTVASLDSNTSLVDEYYILEIKSKTFGINDTIEALKFISVSILNHFIVEECDSSSRKYDISYHDLYSLVQDILLTNQQQPSSSYNASNGDLVAWNNKCMLMKILLQLTNGVLPQQHPSMIVSKSNSYYWKYHRQHYSMSCNNNMLEEFLHLQCRLLFEYVLFPSISFTSTTRLDSSTIPVLFELLSCIPCWSELSSSLSSSSNDSTTRRSKAEIELAIEVLESISSLLHNHMQSVSSSTNNNTTLIKDVLVFCSIHGIFPILIQLLSIDNLSLHMHITKLFLLLLTNHPFSTLPFDMMENLIINSNVISLSSFGELSKNNDVAAHDNSSASLGTQPASMNTTTTTTTTTADGNKMTSPKRKKKKRKHSSVESPCNTTTTSPVKKTIKIPKNIIDNDNNNNNNKSLESIMVQYILRILQKIKSIDNNTLLLTSIIDMYEFTTCNRLVAILIYYNQEQKQDKKSKNNKQIECLLYEYLQTLQINILTYLDPTTTNNSGKSKEEWNSIATSSCLEPIVTLGYDLLFLLLRFQCKQKELPVYDKLMETLQILSSSCMKIISLRHNKQMVIEQDDSSSLTQEQQQQDTVQRNKDRFDFVDEYINAKKSKCCKKLCSSLRTSFGVTTTAHCKSNICTCWRIKQENTTFYEDYLDYLLLLEVLPLSSRCILLSCLIPYTIHTSTANCDDNNTITKATTTSFNDTYSNLLHFINSGSTSSSCSTTATPSSIITTCSMLCMPLLFLSNQHAAKNEIDRFLTSAIACLDGKRNDSSSSTYRYYAYTSLTYLMDITGHNIQLLNNEDSNSFMLLSFFFHNTFFQGPDNEWNNIIGSSSFIYEFCSRLFQYLCKFATINGSQRNLLCFPSDRNYKKNEYFFKMFPLTNLSSLENEESDEVRLAAWIYLSYCISFFDTSDIVNANNDRATLDETNDNDDKSSLKIKNLSIWQWFFRTPFCDASYKVRKYSSSSIGKILFSSSFMLGLGFDKRILSLFLSSSNDDCLEDEEWIKTSFIQELDSVLVQYCVINPDNSTTTLLTSFTGTMVRPSMTMYSFLSQQQQPPPTKTNEKERTSNDKSDAGPSSSLLDFQHSSICSLSSLSEYSRRLDSTTTSFIFQECIIRIIRFWVISPSSSSSSSLAFSELLRLNNLKALIKSSSALSKKDYLLLSSIVIEILSPFSSSLSATASECSTTTTSVVLQEVENKVDLDYYPFKKRCQNVILFYRAFVLSPHCPFSSNDKDNAVFRKILDTFEVHLLPIILTTLLLNKDYESLRMCGGFRFYLQKHMNHRNFSPQIRRSTRKCISDDKKAPFISSFKENNYSDGEEMLNQETKKMCLEKQVMSYIVPNLLLSSNPNAMMFYLTTVLNDNEVDYCQFKEFLATSSDAVLKDLVWELDGMNFKQEDVLKALKNTALILQIMTDESQSSPQSSSISEEIFNILSNSTSASYNDTIVHKWVGSSFLYLFINVVQSRSEQMRAVKCFQQLIRYLPLKEAHKFLSPILSYLDAAISSSYSSEMRYVATKILSQFISMVLQHQQYRIIGENLGNIVVTLFPALGVVDDHNHNHTINSPDAWADATEAEAVAILDVLVNGKVSHELSSYFSNIPFIPPSNPRLDKIRNALRSFGLDFDNLSITLSVNPSSTSSATTARTSLQRATSLQQRLRALCKLISHENLIVRKVVIQYITDLLRANRSIFYQIVQTEAEENITRFALTVINQKYNIHQDSNLSSQRSSSSVSSSSEQPYGQPQVGNNSVNSTGCITALIQSLRSRCVLERNQDALDKIAICIGEVGAIDPNRLRDGAEQQQQNTAASTGEGSNCNQMYHYNQWTIANPPWKSQITRYELQIVTKLLPSALKTVPSVIDQHKLAFTIQELLILLDAFAKHKHQYTATSSKQHGTKENDTDTSHATKHQNTTSRTTREMNIWLKEKLETAKVLDIVEPMWTTLYTERDNYQLKSPPFYSKMSSYEKWISHWCRYLIESSHKNSKSKWKDLFYACRAAIRSPSGLGLAEFLLPLLILDALSFGDEEDERNIIQELQDVLAMKDHQSSRNTITINKTEKFIFMDRMERQKAVTTIFFLLDTFRIWSETVTEEDIKRPKRNNNATELLSNDWASDQSISHIHGILKNISFDLCAKAAADTEMYARSLRFLEMNARSHTAKYVFEEIFDVDKNDDNDDSPENSKANHKKNIDAPGGAVASLSKIDLGLMQHLFGKLNDYDELKAVAQESVRIGISRQIIDQINEREVLGDWTGALQAYEQATQLYLKLPTSQKINGNNSRDSETSSDVLGTTTFTSEFDDLQLERGRLKCLVELGQLESVLNQVNGFYNRKGNSSVQNTNFHLLPSAAEAAWRLGRWSLLEQIVTNEEDLHENNVCLSSGLDVDAQYDVFLGQAMLGLYRKSGAMVQNFVQNARSAVMKSLANIANDSYFRSYPYYLKLHLLREIENASDKLCINPSSQQHHDPTILNSTFSELTGSNQPSAWDWDLRFAITSKNVSSISAIFNVRLALSKLANSPVLEGQLWLDLGKRARKAGLHHMSEASLTQCEAVVRSLSEDYSLQISDVDISLNTYVSDLQMQLSKLKYAMGETSAALQMLDMDGIPVQELLLQNEAALKQSVETLIRKYRYASIKGDALNNNNNGEIPSSQIHDFARRLLQSTKWIVEGGLKGGSEVIDRFRLVQKIHPQFERGHFLFGRYLDSLLEARISALRSKYRHLSNDDDTIRLHTLREDTICHRYLLSAMREYGDAIEASEKHIYQSLPRLLTIWFDFTSLKSEGKVDKSVSKNGQNSLSEQQEKANMMMAHLIKAISPTTFYKVLAQLVSRVGHSNDQTVEILKGVLRRVLARYPREAMWPLAWLRHSADSKKVSIGDEIFHQAQIKLEKQEKNVKMGKLLGTCKGLFKFLIDLAKYVPKKENSKTINVRIPDLGVDLSEFVPPVQSALASSYVSAASSGTSMFPTVAPRMRAFSPQVQVMSSKARPKKLVAFAIPDSLRQNSRNKYSSEQLEATDIGEMHFLVKQEAKGDLRKDARVQDLNNVINRLLAGSGSQGADGKRWQRRRLHLPTFSVICLSEECGIIEWYPNTDSFRNLVAQSSNPQASPHSARRCGSRMANFSDMSLKVSYQKCQDMYVKNGNLHKAASMFEELCLKKYPPVFYWWFVQNFFDPHSWFEARTRFALSCAVWSAVGHVIGLGDRHSENILMDTSNGECVHVDFDCIFDKALYLPRPEIVPFRLSPNMIDAFGPTGYEGTYRGGLISAMSTLRENRDTLLSVLEPFLKDPIIDWKKQRSQQKRVKGLGNTTEAKRSITVIDGRLRGIYNLRNPNLKQIPRSDGYSVDEDEMSHIVPLSIEGQVHRMISEATHKENLVQLYIGWMPWL